MQAGLLAEARQAQQQGPVPVPLQLPRRQQATSVLAVAVPARRPVALTRRRSIVTAARAVRRSRSSSRCRCSLSVSRPQQKTAPPPLTRPLAGSLAAAQLLPQLRKLHLQHPLLAPPALALLRQ